MTSRVKRNAGGLVTVAIAVVTGLALGNRHSHGTAMPVVVTTETQTEHLTGVDVVLEPPAKDYTPVVSAQKAAAIAEDYVRGGSSYSPMLALFSNLTSGDSPTPEVAFHEVPTWVVDAEGVCVFYRGPDQEKHDPCASDHESIVVGAETGQVIFAYSQNSPEG